ncbi:MAG: GH92 family glycosyl hydrolase [Bacteroidales bacterium]|nr:GH92 family glycosyl hydrolase [Bacteroidales bacterium]
MNMKYLKIIPTCLAILFLISCGETKKKSIAENDNTIFVNTFIGTGGHGHTFPGATMPHGMVQLSPDTRTLGWDACAGYHYSDNSILGFSHTHLSGTGIGDYGDILFMPYTGDVSALPGSPENPDEGYRSRFNHSSEVSSPGYYSVALLDYNIKAELTASKRAGFHRYTFPESNKSGIIIDLAHTIHGHRNPVNEIRVISDTEIEGYKRTRGWAQNHHVYFYAKFNKSFQYELYENGKPANQKNSLNTTNTQIGLSFETGKDEEVLAKVGISSVDYKGARNNLNEEIKDWDFEEIKQLAHEEWRETLSKINIEGGSFDEKVIFYTGLYHSNLAPYLFTDIDGRYRGMDQKIHHSDGENIYTVFSIWDTYRAFHPLLNIIQPSFNNDLIKSLLTKYDQGGILPKWELAANYTGTMIGYHAISVIADAYLKGIRDFDIEKAYRAMIESSHYDTTGIFFPSERVKEKLMPMARHYNDELGFIPNNLENESVSKALEYAYNDWCIAQMAKELGKEEDYKTYIKRSTRYREYYDKSTGFMRGKNDDGSWRTPFNPRFSEHRNDAYTEGNAFQWTWYVPHDVSGLMDIMGGEESFLNNLDTLFNTSSDIEGDNASSDISGLIGQYAHGNEPSHHIIFMYNEAGEAWKTQKYADSIMNSLYFNDPNGLSGNEDCGQMSAWYVMNAMGIYSICPGDTKYSIGRPLFDKLTVQLENGNEFVVKTINNSRSNLYIQKASLNGENLDKASISHSDIMIGGILEFEMGNTPNKNWGSNN